MAFECALPVHFSPDVKINAFHFAFFHSFAIAIFHLHAIFAMLGRVHKSFVLGFSQHVFGATAL